MTSDELKKLLEDSILKGAVKRSKRQSSTGNDGFNQAQEFLLKVGYEDGANEILKLLWPLVEALEEYANADDDSESSPVTHAARQALQDLKEKLKGSK